jgi:transcriptional regulator with XRE-family HTH domain
MEGSQLMSATKPLSELKFRRLVEEEKLVGDTAETIRALLLDLEISQRELAARLGVTEGRVSQMLDEESNLTLKSLAGIGWALGLEFDLCARPMTQKGDTPAANDKPVPQWLERLPRVRATPRIYPLDNYRSPAPSAQGGSAHVVGRHTYDVSELTEAS